MASEVRRPIWKRPTTILGVTLPVFIAVLVAVMATVAEMPRLDATNAATLDASLQKITASMSDDQKKAFLADCTELTLSGTMKTAYQNAFLYEGPPESSGRKMYKPLHGMTAAEIHRKAENAREMARREAKESASSTASEPLPGVPPPFGAAGDAKAAAPQ
jgi:hypothetical protein